MRRVVITGCGSINALGSNLEETWESLAEGKDGISELDIRDKERLSSRIGGQVDLSKIEKSNLLGEILAKRAKEKNISNVYFDRGPYKYHGRIKAFAETLRKNGLKF